MKIRVIWQGMPSWIFWEFLIPPGRHLGWFSGGGGLFLFFITCVWLPKPPGSTLSRIIKWAKTILGSLCACFLLSYPAPLWCPQLPQTVIYSLDNLPGHQFPPLPSQNLLVSLKGNLPFLEGLLCTKCSAQSALPTWPHLVPTTLLET